MPTDRPTTITGELTGDDPIATRPRIVALLLGCAFTAPLALAAAAAWLTYLYDQRSPVVVDFRVQTQFIADDAGVIVEGTMTKVRGCDFVEVSARTAEGQVSAVTFLDLKPRAPTYSRPLGPQKFGPWYVEGQPGQGITLSAVHRCHFLWTHYEVLGGFVVGQQ